MKLQEKLLAIELRKAGWSYKRIEKRISVSRGTLSVWLRDIELSEKQKKELIATQARGWYKSAKVRQKRRELETTELANLGKKEAGKLMKDPLFICGLSLYWAEGAKHRGETVKFTNSDEKMIPVMMRWFREICKVPEEKFRVGLHVHNLHIRKDVKSFWSSITGIPENQFHKIYVKKSSLKQRRNVLYNGTCGIIIHDRKLFRRISGWKLGLLENI